MPNERAILCGSVSTGNLPFGADRPVRLRLHGPRSNVTLTVDDIRQSMFSDVPGRFVDLLEIATCVYVADQAVTRGGSGVENVGEDWRRKLLFRIPVREPDFWSSRAVLDPLVHTLALLSEDEYFFEFERLRDPPAFQSYFKLTDASGDSTGPEEVVLFSGGLDSLGGSILEAVVNKRRVALVNHRSTQKLARRYGQLRNMLADRAAHPPLHVPVVINKAKALGREHSQRSRSFLYIALAGTIAQMFGLSRVRVYENGVVSLNLPPSPQVVGARATRTTHPQVINGFAEVLTAVSERSFAVETPFLWRTKAEVLELIRDADCADMVRHAVSCTHTWEATRLHTHCGMCSQCIDRRFAALAVGMGEDDPAEAYKVDLLLGEPKEGHQSSMLVAFTETANEIDQMQPKEFFARYGEVSRVLRHLDGSPDATALKVFELYKRHAKQITGVLKNAIARHSSDILRRVLPPRCLLRLAVDSSGQQAVPTTNADAIQDLIAEPTTGMPDNVFRRDGRAWRVRFAGGRSFTLLPSKGAAYLHLLLSRPGRPLAATEMAVAVAKEPSRFALGSAGEVLDDEAQTAYLARYEDLKCELDEAKDNNDIGQQARVEREMESLMGELKRARGLGGRIRRASDDRERVRKKVGIAIRRARESIAIDDRRLAAHLNSSVRCGRSPCYNPQEEVKWQTE